MTGYFSGLVWASPHQLFRQNLTSESALTASNQGLRERGDFILDL